MPNLLKVFKSRRIAVTLLLAFSSGLPLPLVLGTLKAWMASENVNLKTIGIFSLVGLPYTLKFLWAPFLDRYSPPFLNRRTGWMVIFQVMLMITIGLMGMCDPVHEPWKLAAMAVVVAFFSASQDIVIDAYRAELLPPEERGPGAGVTTVGARIALLTSGAIALILSDHLTWAQVYILMAGLMGVGLVTAIFAPPAEAAERLPRTLTDAVIQPFISYLQRPGALYLLLFIVLYKLGDAVAGDMITPFLIKTGFTRTYIGTINKGFGMGVTIVGSLFGGAMVTKLGIRRALWIFGVLQAVSHFSFVMLANVGKSYPMMITAVGIENICGGMGTAAFVAFLMSLTNKQFTATQYALLTSVMAVTRTMVGTFTGYLASAVGWPWYFTVAAMLALPGLLLLARFKTIFAQVDDPVPA